MPEKAIEGVRRMVLRVAGLLKASFVNGEGCRFVVFAQGCPHHCEGCQNPDTHSTNEGWTLPVGMIAEAYEEKRQVLDGLTLSGGEPFMQQQALIELIKLTKPESVWCYTGFTFEQVEQTELIKYIDVLVDGRFEIDKKVEGKMYGSSNQRIIDVKKSLNAVDVVLWGE